MRPSKIPISQIRLDGDTQPRATINEDVVAEYAEQMKASVKFPPIEVYQDGAALWLADGFHRYHAANRAGLDSINGHIHKGTKAEAAWHSVACNQQHGLRRTNADKRKAVEMALRLKPDASDRVIAEHVGVSDKTVAAVRSTAEIPQLAQRTGRDGRVRQTPPDAAETRGGMKGGTDAAPAACPPVAPGSAVQDAPSAPAGGGTPGKVPAVIIDQSGQEIEVDGLPEVAKAFRRRSEVNDLMTSLSRTRRQIEQACEKSDPLFSELNLDQFSTDLDNARAQLRLKCLPHALCLRCGGQGCEVCHDRGWVSELVFRHEPDALKKGLAK